MRFSDCQNNREIEKILIPAHKRRRKGGKRKTVSVAEYYRRARHGKI